MLVVSPPTAPGSTLEDVGFWLLVATGAGVALLVARALLGCLAGSRTGSLRRLRLLEAAASELAYAVVGGDGSLHETSRELAILLEAPQLALTSISAIEPRLHADDRATWARAAEARARGGTETLQFQCRLRRTPGDWCWLHVVQRRVEGRGEPLYVLRFVDFTAQRAAEDRAMRLADLEKAKSVVLSMLSSPHDPGAALRRAIEVVAQALKADRAAFCAVNTAAGRASFELEWIAPNAVDVASALTQRQLLPPHAVLWWLDAFSGGKPVFLTRDAATLADPVRAARLPPDVQSMLVIPCFALGEVRGAITVEFVLAPGKVAADEMSLASTLAFAASRLIERGDFLEERRARGEAERRLARSELLAQLARAVQDELRDTLFALSSSQPDGPTARATESVRRIVFALTDAIGAADDDMPVADAATEIADAIGLMRRLSPRDFTIDARIDIATGTALAMPRGAVRRTIVALLAAARESIGRGGRALVHAGIEPREMGPAVVVHVDDAGPAPVDERRAHVLTPSIALAPRTELLVAIARRTLEDAGGTLDGAVSPTLGGRRSTATIALSGDGGHSAPTAPEAWRQAADSLPDVGRAMVVDADPEVLAVLTEALEALDIEVHARTDVSDVDRAILDGPLRYDLLVLDIDLPDDEGGRCLERLRARGSLIPTIVTTDGRTDAHSSLAPLRILRKPFPLEALLREARGVIDDARAWRR